MVVHKFDILDESDQFSERHNPLKLIQEGIGDLNRPISILKIESIINDLLKHKAPGLDGSLVNSTQRRNYTNSLHSFSENRSTSHVSQPFLGG